MGGGGKQEGGLRGRKWSERPRSSGRLTFYKTAVLSQVLVLSISAALFFNPPFLH